MIRWLRNRFTPKGAGVRYSDALLFGIPEAITYDWACQCEQPWGIGKVLNPASKFHCEYCGMEAPWLRNRAN